MLLGCLGFVIYWILGLLVSRFRDVMFLGFLNASVSRFHGLLVSCVCRFMVFLEFGFICLLVSWLRCILVSCFPAFLAFWFDDFLAGWCLGFLVFLLLFTATAWLSSFPAVFRCDIYFVFRLLS